MCLNPTSLWTPPLDSYTKKVNIIMNSSKFVPGCYLINNLAIIEIQPSIENNYEITLVYAGETADNLFLAGTKITKSNQQLSKLMSRLDYKHIDSIKAEVVAELYGKK